MRRPSNWSTMTDKERQDWAELAEKAIQQLTNYIKLLKRSKGKYIVNKDSGLE